ncbi:MAG: monovalent cation/H+ antiporter complex subunit F [Nitrospirota bacterium]|uniref:Na(+) H(+) antiporter subunit F n=1 Tax=hydrothermal vent metagenome TaxID=652676 RepID=A0A3B1CST1_9ZZZZ|nr:monovalent cation/H+ antiporter complex subunit F [Nitrospirota bacterium]
MIDLVANIAFAILAISFALCLYRLLAGPTLPDRVVAIDTITTIIIAMIAVYCMKEDSAIFYDAILVLSILGFVGTVSMAKFLARGGKIFDA